MNRREYIRDLMERGAVLDTAMRRELAAKFNCSAQNIGNEIYRIKNPRYWDRHRSIHQVSSENARARRLGLTEQITTEEWNGLCLRYGNKCLCCGREEFLVIDHVIPLSRGGEHAIANIQPLCSSCNRRKSNTCTDYRDKMDDTGRPATYWRGTIGREGRQALDTLAAGAHEGETIARVLIAMERWHEPLNQLAADLGFADGQALLDALTRRYDAQPGLVRTGLRDALLPADERRVVAAAVEEMLAERDAPDPKDYIL